MRGLLPLLLLASCRADKPAVAPAYQAPAPVEDTYGAPSKPVAVAAAAPDSYGSPVAPPAQDTYGSPVAAPVAQPDSYGSPAAPVQDTYGSPAAAPASPGNQGYYYYYYPVKQNYQEAEKEEDGGLLGGLLGGGLAGLLTTKALLLILGIAGAVLITSLALKKRRSFASRALQPYMTTGNLIALLESVNSALAKYQ